MTRFEVVDLYLRAHIGPLLQNAAAYVDVARCCRSGNIKRQAMRLQRMACRSLSMPYSACTRIELARVVRHIAEVLPGQHCEQRRARAGHPPYEMDSFVHYKTNSPFLRPVPS
jgi:hypothetical protein